MSRAARGGSSRWPGAWRRLSLAQPQGIVLVPQQLQPTFVARKLARGLGSSLHPLMGRRDKFRRDGGDDPAGEKSPWRLARTEPLATRRTLPSQGSNSSEGPNAHGKGDPQILQMAGMFRVRLTNPSATIPIAAATRSGSPARKEPIVRTRFRTAPGAQTIS